MVEPVVGTGNAVKELSYVLFFLHLSKSGTKVVFFFEICKKSCIFAVKSAKMA